MTLSRESVEALSHYPEGWRIGRDGSEWTVYIPDSGYLSVSGLWVIPKWQEIARGSDLDQAIGEGLAKTYACDHERCIVERPVDQRKRHRHRLREKNTMELLFERALPSVSGAQAGPVTISFPRYGAIEATPRNENR